MQLEGAAFFTEVEFHDTAAVAKAVLRFFGCTHAASLYDCDPSLDKLEQLEEAERFAASLPHVEPRPEHLTQQGLPGFDFMASDIALGLLDTYITPGRCVCVSMPFNVGRDVRFAADVQEAIPSAVRGDCDIWPSSFYVGRQDVWVKDPHGRLVFRAHPTFLFGFFPKESPWKPAEYASLIFHVPVIKDLKRDLEKIVGPLEQFAYWQGMADG